METEENNTDLATDFRVVTQGVEVCEAHIVVRCDMGAESLKSNRPHATIEDAEKEAVEIAATVGCPTYVQTVYVRKAHLVGALEQATRGGAPRLLGR